MSKRVVWLAMVLTLMVGTIGPVAPAAHATFPGKNGRIAFSTGFLFPNEESPDRTQIVTVRPDGSDLRQVTNVPSGHHAGAPDWSPDGTKILFQSDAGGDPGRFQIWVMNADGSGATQITSDPEHSFFFPSWSANGKHIVVSRCTEIAGFVAFCDVAVLNADGTGVRTIVGGRWMHLTPTFSPDGDRIVFDSNKGGLQSAVWTVNTDGSDLRRLTPARLRAFWADWSPDGRRILFSDNCCVPHSNVWVMKADGSRRHQLTQVPANHNKAFARFSPDGSKIVLLSDIQRVAGGEFNDLFIMNADGTGFRRITTTRPRASFSDWGVAP